MGFVSSRNLVDNGEIFDPEAEFHGGDTEAEESNDKDSSEENHYIDLGSLQIPPVPGINLGFLGDSEQSPLGVEVVFHGAQMQLTAFAAPRSGGYWEEHMGQLDEMFTKEGFTTFPLAGKYGEALLCKPDVESKNTQAAQVGPMLFWGIERNRYLLRVLFRGKAATEENTRQLLLPILEQIQVLRGESPMAPGDILPLHIPVGLRQIG